ncbi:MAG TPA: class I SAM-dependent methyltransferase [Aggregatilineaceae bacterium]|nr:class I SAM-dependent methyltransferase [Aggregatilineaceae bacterium]
MRGDRLVSLSGREYPVISDIPVILPEDIETTHIEQANALKFLRGELGLPHCSFAESAVDGDTVVDQFVQRNVAGTSGHLYALLISKLSRYPIPDIRLPQGNGELLLDVGCNWGRWRSAARKGYRVVGIDPALESVLAAQRIARQLGQEVSFVVADGRSLPFKSGCFDVVFSYSVLQHFSHTNARKMIDEIGRVLKPGAIEFVQMPNVAGVRSEITTTGSETCFQRQPVTTHLRPDTGRSVS